MPKLENRRTIAVDIDEVLAHFAESFVKYSNEKWGTNLKPEDWDEHWAKLWGITHDETSRRAIEVYASDVFISARPNNEANEALTKLSHKYDLVVVTSRHRSVTKDTLEWIEKKFRHLFKEIHFAGIYDDIEKSPEERLKATKAEICRQIGADYLIDDAPKHCLAASEAGIKSVLFGDYPWNRKVKILPNMVRAKNWQEVLEYFDAES